MKVNLIEIMFKVHLMETEPKRRLPFSGDLKQMRMRPKIFGVLF